MIKTYQSSQKNPIKIEVELNNGQRLHGVVQPVSPALRFTFVGFNKELNKLYIYIENSGDEIIPLKKLYLMKNFPPPSLEGSRENPNVNKLYF